MIKENDAMTAPKSMDPGQFLREQAASADSDVLRAMVKTFADALMGAEADAICGAPYGQRSDERTNHRNGYRPREWDTRAGTEAVALSGLSRRGMQTRRSRMERTSGGAGDQSVRAADLRCALTRQSLRRLRTSAAKSSSAWQAASPRRANRRRAVRSLR